MTRTKIVCTLGPACNSPDQVIALVHAGMNIARLNFSHGSHETHGKSIRILHEVRKTLSVPLAIMLDTKGPEIRLGRFREESVALKEGQEFWLHREEVEGSHERASLRPAGVIDELKKGMVVLFDNGYIVLRVSSVSSKGAQLIVEHGGLIRSTKGVNIPGLDWEVPALTDQDIADIRFGCREGVDYIAASFVRSAEDVRNIRFLLDEAGASHIKIIAKIENGKGVDHFAEILAAADGIMVARGDLGVELPLHQVPRLQKWIIAGANSAGKPVVTATQMLESMIQNPRPTRAEASDVANAIYDSTSAVMLSGETAVGAYPTRAVQVMKEIIDETERDFGYEEFLKQQTKDVILDVPSSVAAASIKTAYISHAKALFVFTTSGATAWALSRLRPKIPVIAMTANEDVFHQLALAWGVIPILERGVKNFDEAYQKMKEFAVSKGFLRFGDLVVITAGTPFGRAGTTNMMIVEAVSNTPQERIFI